jgi:hypothetical protein
MTETVRRSLYRCVDYGEAYYVSREMTDYLLHEIVERHMQHKELFHLDQGDLPSRIGFVYFDGDVPLPTDRSRTGFQNLRAVAWDQYTVKRGEQRGFYIDPQGEQDVNVAGKILYTICDSPNPKDRDDYGPWKPRHYIPAEYGVRMEPGHINFDDEVGPDFVRLNPTDDPDLGKQQAEASVRVVFRLMGAWMALIQTEIPVLHPRPAAYDKVMHKEGRPPADVKVTLLRRYAQTAPHGMAEVDWAYRWKVKEHYRWQRVGPGRSFVRRVLVREHWKGPDDKPKHEYRDEVTALVRGWTG